MKNIGKKAIGQIVADDFRTYPVFESYKIDYYNKGKQDLEEVADEHRIDLQALTNEIIKKRESTSEENPDFNSWSLDALSEYIVKTYHAMQINKYRRSNQL